MNTVTKSLTETYDGIPAVSPLDEHNRRWVANVRPAHWTNPSPAGVYNLLVIGAGPAGLVAALGAAGLGAKVAIVEKHLLGGDCLNVGCVPSKAMIAAGRAAASVRKAGEFGVKIPPGVTVDFGEVMDRLRRLRADLSTHDSADRFTQLGVDVFIGDGQFAGPDSFQVGDAMIRFAKACICTGARAAAPPIPGLDSVDYLTNETVFTLTEKPARLGIIGAGPIGCELAQAFARFGSEVHLLESTHGILPREDQEAAEIVKASMLRDGVKIYCCGKQTRVENIGDSIRLAFESHEQGHDITVDKLLVAAGRTPNIEGLDLERAGVEYGRRGIKVDDRLRTTNPRIFAAGDVASEYQFTHAADFMARIVIGNALFFGRAKASALTIPWATYTEPELAHVGMSADDLENQGIAYSTHTIRLDTVDRAILDGEDEGMIKVHADRRGRILGATVVAAHAGDLIGEISLAMTNDLRLGQVAKAIHPYPTQGEVFRKIGDSFNRTRLKPWIASAMRTFLRWRR